MLLAIITLINQMNQLVFRTIRPLLAPLRCSMSRDVWKDRDDAAEKVYISSEESKRWPTQRGPSRSW